MCVFKCFNDGNGQTAVYFMEQATLRGISIQFERNNGVVTYREISICSKGRRPDSGIYQIWELDSPPQLMSTTNSTEELLSFRYKHPPTLKKVNEIPKYGTGYNVTKFKDPYTRLVSDDIKFQDFNSSIYFILPNWFPLNNNYNKYNYFDTIVPATVVTPSFFVYDSDSDCEDCIDTIGLYSAELLNMSNTNTAQKASLPATTVLAIGTTTVNGKVVDVSKPNVVSKNEGGAAPLTTPSLPVVAAAAAPVVPQTAAAVVTEPILSGTAATTTVVVPPPVLENSQSITATPIVNEIKPEAKLETQLNSLAIIDPVVPNTISVNAIKPAVNEVMISSSGKTAPAVPASAAAESANTVSVNSIDEPMDVDNDESVLNSLRAGLEKRPELMRDPDYMKLVNFSVNNVERRKRAESEMAANKKAFNHVNQVVMNSYSTLRGYSKSG